MKREASNAPLLKKRGGRRVTLLEDLKTGERIRALILWTEDREDVELYELDDNDNALAIRDYPTWDALFEEWRGV